MDCDVIIIGGSYAGLSAGLPLARARRSVLVVDAGERRNRFAPHAHGFLTQDGVPPADIAAEGRAQLMDYTTVDWLNTEVSAVRTLPEGFEVALRHGAPRRARRLILAAGVRDELPALPGLAERWGLQVFHCPYCHGYELHEGAVGVLAVSELSLHQALMLPDWGATCLFLNDSFEPTAEQLAQLQARRVDLVRGPVARLAGERLTVVMRDGRSFALDGLFIATRTHPSPLAAQLGCEMAEGPMGRFVKTDEMKATSVPGVFACGDLARPTGSLPLAVGDGAMAGVAAHRSLMFGLG
ncbi:NAD(P)/FAD-dependent oxidoreductase [Ideonella azotifigens]|uniref:NAD(P)/FAD-dependent oxidoreductase n=1 Tax=Ideonella azotifigens TaxID=513160 RepID=A0ABP3UYL7_9BURK|nr:NAD(P)/FAD-dependent oxidoreductase [Ideonella azotifigens]MCD2340254.1 NAD(P)/FAD-dependent oxidoreductase [Ideonella azotifigens]